MIFLGLFLDSVTITLFEQSGRNMYYFFYGQIDHIICMIMDIYTVEKSVFIWVASEIDSKNNDLYSSDIYNMGL